MRRSLRCSLGKSVSWRCKAALLGGLFHRISDPSTASRVIAPTDAPPQRDLTQQLVADWTRRVISFFRDWKIGMKIGIMKVRARCDNER